MPISPSGGVSCLRNEALKTESWQFNHYIYCGGNVTTDIMV